MSSLEQSLIAADHLHSKALAGAGRSSARVLRPGSNGASHVRPVANAVGRLPNNVVVAPSLVPCPTFTVVAGDPLTRWAPFLSPSALTRLRRAARAASTQSELIAQILEFMYDESAGLTYGSAAFEAERRKLAKQGKTALLAQVKAASQSDTAPRQVLRLARAMVFASEQAQVDAIRAEIGLMVRVDRARVLDAVRRVQSQTGRCASDFGPSDCYAVLVECRRPTARPPRSGVRGARMADPPKQYWSLTAPLERYVRRRVVEHALDALEVITHFNPMLLDQVTRDRMAFAALLDAAYALAVDATAKASDWLTALDFAAARLGLVGSERPAALGPRPSRVRDYSVEGESRRKDARGNRFPIENRTREMISRGMASVDDESPASRTQKLLVDRLRDSRRPRLP